MSSSEFRHDINGLRGFSVALVVAFHLHLRGSGGGFIGVDVFFVISGYLMTKIIWDGMQGEGFSFWRFVGARAARIWPALAVMVFALLLLGAWLLPPFDLELLSYQAFRALLFWSNQFFHDRSGYNTQTADTNWLLHTWSLSVEWQFYVLYPLVLMGAAKWWAHLRPRSAPADGRAFLMASVVVLLVLSLGCQVLLGAAGPQSAFFLLPSRAWEMLAGGLICFIEPRGAADRPAARAFVSYAGMALVVASALLFGRVHLYPVGLNYQLLLPVAGVAMVLWARYQGNIVLNNALIQKLGLWSYGIYLWHWPFIVGLRMTDAFLDHPHLASLGVAAGSLVCGWLSYRFVESRAHVPHTRARKTVLAMGLAAAATSLAAATDGLAMRGNGRPDFHRGYAASIQPLYFPDHCGNFQKTAAQSQLCQIQKGSKRRVLVIGDSHAEHLYPWFVAHSAVSVDFFTQAECPPVPRFERAQSGFHCMDYAAAAWQKAASPAYDTVVLAARWAGVGLNGAPYCHAKEGGDRCVFASVPEKQALVRAELLSAIEGLLAKGKTVVMVKPTPEARVRVPERITRENFWYGQTRLAIDERSLAELTGWLAPLFDAMKGRPGFRLVSLNDKLCSGSVCKVFDEALKRPIYIDESHFDPVWMAKNGEVFAPFVQPD